MIESYQPMVEKLIINIEKVIIGKRKEVELSIVALLADGHVLLEDVPGVGKTMMVRSIAKSVSAGFRRIQFTPDLLPSDITGSNIYNPKDMKFEYRQGPIMANIVLADEINRTSPKTQSALLEAMEEGNVTVDGDTKKLPTPFFVMATQNPIDYEGTFPLPEAQIDRFLLKINLGYPNAREEREVLDRALGVSPIESIEPVLLLDELLGLQKNVKGVYVDETVKSYIIDIVHATRNHPSIYNGVSPRGSIALMRAAQAFAFIFERDFVVPDDVKTLAPYVLGHRIMLRSELKFTGTSTKAIILEIVEKTPVPTSKGLKHTW